MEHLLSLMFLDDLNPSVVVLLCMMAGGIVGACLPDTRRRMRRVIFFLWLTVIWFLEGSIWNLLVSVLPAAARDGYLSAATGAAMVAWGLIGLLLYRVSSARSLDMRGDTRRAWMGFLLILSLWLLFRPGRPQPGAVPPPRRGLGAWATDALIVFMGVCVIAGTLRQAEDTLQINVFDEPGGEELLQRLTSAMPLAKLLSLLADDYNSRPPYSDIATAPDAYVKGAKVQGTTLQIEYVTPDGAPSLADTAATYCDPYFFVAELGRGAVLDIVFNAPDGSPVDRYTITSADCGAVPG